MSETKKASKVPLRVRLACLLLKGQGVQTYFVRVVVAGIIAVRETQRFVAENSHLRSKAPHVQSRLLTALQKAEQIFTAADFQPSKDTPEHFGLLQAELVRAKEDAQIATQERDGLKVRLEEQVRLLSAKLNEAAGQNGRLRRRLDRASLQQLPYDVRSLVETLRQTRDTLRRLSQEVAPDLKTASWSGYVTPALVQADAVLKPFVAVDEPPVEAVQS